MPSYLIPESLLIPLIPSVFKTLQVVCTCTWGPAQYTKQVQPKPTHLLLHPDTHSRARTHTNTHTHTHTQTQTHTHTHTHNTHTHTHSPPIMVCVRMRAAACLRFIASSPISSLTRTFSTAQCTPSFKACSNAACGYVCAFVYIYVLMCASKCHIHSRYEGARVKACACICLNLRKHAARQTVHCSVLLFC